MAQRYYEMSAEQGSASSELRLGDYTYYGWGIAAFYKDNDGTEVESGSVGDQEEEDAAFLASLMSGEPELEIRPQPVDYEASIARYRKTAEMQVTGEWMQAFVARASFNLGLMHQFGLGVAQDLHLAKRHYHRCREVHPDGVHVPVTLVLLLLGVHMAWLRVPAADELISRLFNDVRVHMLVVHIIAISVLFMLRSSFSNTRQRPRTPTGEGLPPQSPVSPMTHQQPQLHPQANLQPHSPPQPQPNPPPQPQAQPAAEPRGAAALAAEVFGQPAQPTQTVPDEMQL